MPKLFTVALTSLFISAAAAASEASLYKAPDFRLGDLATPIDYKARLAIDPTEKYFAGEIKIGFKFNRATPVLWLNATQLFIDEVEFTQGPRTIAARVVAGNDDVIGFEAIGAPFAAGLAIANIRYRGVLEPLSTQGLFKQQEAKHWYVVSQFEALSARRAFPTFDEPGWKTPWQLILDVPKGNVAVSNTPEVAAYDIPDRAGWRRHAFAVTKPLPTYLIAMAVGPFDIVDGGTAGKRNTPLRYFVPKGRGDQLAWVKASTPKVLTLLEDYFGTPYPFEKLDSVTIPQAVNFGAMENVGMITYASTLMLAKPQEESTPFKRRYVSIAAHEIAHMWFGNLVTPAWWDDIWLNEAFATWMGQKILYQFQPEWDDGFFRAFSRNQAIKLDKLNAARKVRNPVESKTDVFGAFDSITYQKGGQVLSMFEAWLTPELFRSGVRSYLKRHEFGTATSQDFFRAIGEAAGRKDDAMKAFTGFIDQPGVPLVSVSLQCNGKNAALKVSQQRLRPAGSLADEKEWTTPACFSFSQGGKQDVQCTEVTSIPRTVPLTTAKGCPDWVLGNANGAGYYVTRYNAPLEKRLVANVARLPEQEAIAHTGDVTILSESGLMTIDAALGWAAANIRHASPVVQRFSVELLRAQRDAWLSPAQKRKKQQIISQSVLPLATKLGWMEKPADSERTRSLRVVLLPFAAEHDKEPTLRVEARELALKWMDNRDAIPVSLLDAVLGTAARFADSTTYERIEAAALASEDRRETRALFSALAKVQEKNLRERSLSLAVQSHQNVEKMNGREVQLFLNDALLDPHNRSVAFSFVRANFDALVAKLPPDTPAQTMNPLGQLCTGDARALFVDFYKDRAAKFLGGPRRYNQALESIDLCVAARDTARPVASVRTGR